VLINELLELKDRDIVSIVGAGGKTSLMFLLANELKNYGKVLVTTTTKIFKPNDNEVKYLALGEEGYKFIKNNSDNGIYVYGKFINEENKLIAPDLEKLNFLRSDFNFILIEADGSKKKSLKAWNSYEPVIISNTSKTIGVLSLKSIGMKINSDNIHRLEEFITLTNSEVNDEVNLDMLVKIIFSDNGLFKNAVGKNILFINAIDYIDEKVLFLLIEKIVKKNKDIKLLDKIIYGSLRDKVFKGIKF